MVKKVNYLGINHELVPKHFKGNPKFINYFNINGIVAAVYLTTDKLAKKLYGYKKYMLLYKQGDKYMISGIDKLNNKVDAIKCNLCDDVVYSCYTHDYNTCSCLESFIDVGLDYTSYNPDNSTIGTLNLLNDTFKESKIGKDKKQQQIRSRTSSRGNKKATKRNQKNKTRK